MIGLYLEFILYSQTNSTIIVPLQLELVFAMTLISIEKKLIDR